MRGVALLTAVTFVAENGRCATFRHTTTINGLSRFGPLGTLDRQASPARQHPRARRVLVEGAWTYRLQPVNAKSWVTTAIAREMSAFLWAIGREVAPRPAA
jgi:transposase